MTRGGFDAEAVPAQNQTRRILAYCQPKMVLTTGSTIDYLAFGVKYVWLIDPEDKSAWVYTAERKREPVRVLTTAEPNISLPLDELFAALDEEVEP
jgi:hypothetical protein